MIFNELALSAVQSLFAFAIPDQRSSKHSPDLFSQRLLSLKMHLVHLYLGANNSNNKHFSAQQITSPGAAAKNLTGEHHKREMRVSFHTLATGAGALLWMKHHKPITRLIKHPEPQPASFQLFSALALILTAIDTNIRLNETGGAFYVLFLSQLFCVETMGWWY
jgi:hypothetical protein